LKTKKPEKNHTVHPLFRLPPGGSNY
jgi:hypothetical protein